MANPFVYYVTLDVPGISSASSFIGIFKGLSGLEVNFEVLEYKEGGNNDFVHRLPGRISYPNLVLSWGLVANDETLLKWFAATQQSAQLKDINVTLSATSDTTQNVRTFVFGDAFPVRWSGPVLQANSVDPSTWGETLEIAHSGLKLPS